MWLDVDKDRRSKGAGNGDVTTAKNYGKPGHEAIGCFDRSKFRSLYKSIQEMTITVEDD